MDTFENEPIVVPLDTLTESNPYYRRILYTDPHMQLVLMSIDPFGAIPQENHPLTSQFIRIESGSGWAVVDSEYMELAEGDALMIPAGVYHEIAASDEGLKLYTVYSGEQLHAADDPPQQFAEAVEDGSSEAQYL
jgi:quercetin dioxygenase-like cupin family protein